MGTSKDIVQSFIKLTEKIAHGKTNILDFPKEGIRLYRREIHIIKAVGDFPGIYSSEIARNFGITRAVIYRILLKLERDGLVIKERDERDGKRYKLFLTQRGERAYLLHEDYHYKYDRALFEFLDTLSESEKRTVRDFLKYAEHLISNHF